ncbi:MAG TPA: ABC transporter ATP-binding protein [Dongiaceae bacterium]|nr:ABC transporter ATP-binding protein [Dongiaceae bacterium]
MTAAQPSAILEVRDLRRAFGGIKAANGVSFETRAQEILGVIGPNGSGKSTLFNLISGTLRPDSGRIVFKGADIAGWKPYRIARAGIGRTFQIPALFQNMTVAANLLAAAVEGDWRGAPRRVEEVLELLTLERLRDSPASDLSGGQQKLLELGRVLMRDCELLLLDEVTAGVNPAIRAVILDTVQLMRRRGRTFLVIEHDMEFIRSICERIIVMDFGEVVASGDFDSVTQDSQVMRAYLGRPA